jgi:cysteinyl-tRNA synthetase
MSSRYLGRSFDIHGGGKDLIFPHHENEIAQSETAYGTNFAKYWVHNGFVNVDQEKMSKSLGNFFTIREVLEQYQSEVLRLLLLSSHYRSPLDFSSESMAEAERGLERLYQSIAQAEERVSEGRERGKPSADPNPELETLKEKIEELSVRFHEEMDDDFNTAAALGHLFDMNRALNRFQDNLPQELHPEEIDLLRRGAEHLREYGGVLGLLEQSPRDFFEEQTRVRLAALDIDVEEVERLIAERSEARKEKDWARADEIRDALAAMSIVVEDRPDGSRWKVKQEAPGE